MKKIFVFLVAIFCSDIFAVELKRDCYAIDEENGIYMKKKDSKFYFLDLIPNSEEEIKNYFYDSYGYLQIEMNSDVYTLIDGYFNYLFLNDKTIYATMRKTPDGKDLFIPDGRLNGKNIFNVNASSVLIDKYHTYKPDGIKKVWAEGDIWWCWVKNNIPWVEGKTDDGIGEYIEFDVAESNKRELILSIINGYVNPEKKHLFKENNRIKTAELICDNKDKYIINFNDVVEMTEIKLTKNYKHMRLVIEEVYPGKKYSDTCITAVMVK